MNTVKQPDIQYHPSYDNYIERRARRLAENPDLPNAPLPRGFPNRVDGPIVWGGKDWKSEDQWVYRLSAAELKEIDDALQQFKSGSLSYIFLLYTYRILMVVLVVVFLGLNIAMGFIGKDKFPLPNLSSKLRDLAQELYSGRGFFVLRTIPIDDYSRADLATIYAG